MANNGETMETVADFILGGLQNHCGQWLRPQNWKMLTLWKKSYDKPRQHFKKQTHHFANKGPYSQSYGFSSSHVWMWEVDQKEGWMSKNWCFWTVVLEQTLESPLDSKEIKPVNPKGNQPWIFSGRTDAKTEAPILWPPDTKSWLVGKDPDAGKDWGQEKKGATEDEIVGWHHRLNGHEFEKTLRDSEGQGKPGILQSMGSQRVRHHLATEQQQDHMQWCNVIIHKKKQVKICYWSLETHQNP